MTMPDHGAGAGARCATHKSGSTNGSRRSIGDRRPHRGQRALHRAQVHGADHLAVLFGQVLKGQCRNRISRARRPSAGSGSKPELRQQLHQFGDRARLGRRAAARRMASRAGLASNGPAAAAMPCGIGAASATIPGQNAGEEPIVRRSGGVHPAAGAKQDRWTAAAGGVTRTCSTRRCAQQRRRCGNRTVFGARRVHRATLAMPRALGRSPQQRLQDDVSASRAGAASR